MNQNDFLSKSISDVKELFQTGGFVMIPLLICLIVLWFCLSYRFLTLSRGSRKSIRDLIKEYVSSPHKKSNGFLDTAIKQCVSIQKNSVGDINAFIKDWLNSFQMDLKKFNKTIHIVVLAAPLLGLLGTVTGMIELFDSLTDQEFFSQSGGIAGGISEALITTQMGLCIAIPGMLVQKYLDKKADGLEEELEQLTAAIQLEKF